MTTRQLECVLTGIVREQETGQPISGVTLRAYDKDFFRDQLLGSAVTDEEGNYQLRFDDGDFTGPVLRFERHPDVFVRVFDGEGNLIHSTESSVVVDADRATSLNIALPRHSAHSADERHIALFGQPVNLPAAATLTTDELLTAYRLFRSPDRRAKGFERIERAFPGLFARSEATPECGNGIHDLFRLLFKERDAERLFDDADADPYNGAAVKQFFTANIVVKYTTVATLPDGSANPNQLPAGSATLPAADSTYTMPSGTVIGTVRKNLSDLHPANTEVAPTYIQKVGLLAEYSLARYIAPPFSYLDPRGGMTRLEFRILGLPAGVAGYAVSSDFHMELATSNSDAQNLGTVPHELFHLVQYRYNATAGPATGIRQSALEGGARLIEESINETPNRYVESAADGNIGGSVPRKGIFNFPEETLLDVAGSASLLRYGAGLLWKYVAEQHSTMTGAADEPAIGVDAYRKVLERMTTAGDNFSVAAVRNGRSQLPWYGTFDQFSYYDAAATELNSHETTWANFLLANYFHKLWTPASAGFDRRFDYKEDDDPAGNLGSPLNTLSPAVAAGNVITVGPGTAVTKNVAGHKPYAAVYYELAPNALSAPRMVKINVTTSGGMSDPLVQIVRIGAGNALVDVHRSDRTNYSKTINMSGLSKVLVIVAGRENGGNFTLKVDEVASASDLMVTRWNSKGGTEYEIDPKGWSWTWISPDIMVDTNNDLLDDTEVIFGQNNKLKVRLRNRGNAAATGISINFWYQKATPYLSSAAWIPVKNTLGVTQTVTGATVAAGADSWFGVDWAPANDGTNHKHWCVKVAVTCPTDPNVDNKIAFRNFANVVVGSPDIDFSALVRYPLWSDRDSLLVVPRSPRFTLVLANPTAFPKPLPARPKCRDARGRVILDVPLDLSFGTFKVVESELRAWDGTTTLPPESSGAHYPVDPDSLPPGVRPEEIVTLAHISNGTAVGGVSYRLTE